MYLPNDTISLLEAIHARADLIHLASDVTAKDSGPLLDEDADVLHVTVERVNGDGGILHNNLSGTGCGQWSITDLQRGVGLVKPCSLVLWCRHVFVLWVEFDFGKLGRVEEVRSSELGFVVEKRVKFEVV